MSDAVPAETEARVFTGRTVVRLGDVDVHGDARLDALARYLQDVAADDIASVPMPRGRAWILRRVTLELTRRPRLGEAITMTTACSGTGPRWAERQTVCTVRHSPAEPLVHATALWVYVDGDGAPLPLPAGFVAAYGTAARGRRVSARLRHPGGPPERAERRAFPLRHADFDVLGHVNNAVYWTAVEEVAAGWRAGRPVRRAEIEYRAGIDPGDAVEVVFDAGDDLRLWFVVDGDVRATARLEAAGTESGTT